MRTNLFKTFLERLREEGFKRNDIRFLGIQDELRKQLNSESISEFCRKHSINRGTLYHMLSGRRAVHLNLLDMDKTNELWKYKCIIKNSVVPITIPKELTPKLAYLIGVLRDGTVAKEKKDEYCCAFYNKNLGLLQLIQKYINKVFKIKTKIRNFGDVYGVRIRSKTLFLFLKLVFEIPNKQSKWATPTLIKRSNNELKKWYITGFWDAEGGCPHVEKRINLDRKNLYIKFVQKNKESLIFIKEYLEANNIKTRSIYWNQGAWILKISNKSIPLFSKFINPLHLIKANRLKTLAKIFS